VATKIKTPLTMSGREFNEMLIEQLKEANLALAEMAKRLEAMLGPAPRPDLTLVHEENDDA
jgi:hypothetical protein